MEDIIDATFYSDEDFLTRTLTSSVLYDKNNLDLSFIENNNNNTDKRQQQNVRTNKENTQTKISHPDSPNFDFLKLGSPDLEQMLFNITENTVDSNFSNDDENLNSSHYCIESDYVETENCFTDALQQLHDKQTSLPDLNLIDIPLTVKPTKPALKGVEKRHLKREGTMSPKHSMVSTQHNQSNRNDRVKVLNNSNKNNVSRRHLYNNNLLHNNVMSNQMVNSKPPFHRNVNLMPTANHQNISASGAHNQIAPLSDHMLLHNQINLLNSQEMNTHQLYQQRHQQQRHQQQRQQQQQQQEIAFLTQAMGYHQERENLQSHCLSQGFNNHSHMQQSLLEHQLLQNQLIGGNFQNSLQTMQTDHMNSVDSLASLDLDDQTLKVFMENPHLSSINLEVQELVKRERKKLRNRIASSKCRKRKLEREGKLEDKVKDLKDKNIELNAIANALKQQICDLKQRVMDHVGEGCQIVMPHDSH